MQFKDVIGQQPIKQRLVQAVTEGRVPHALLLAGPPGNGKLALGLAFAQYVNCTNRQNGDSCGVCNSCRKYTKLIHPDLHFTIPVIKTDSVKEPISADYLVKWREYFLANPYAQYGRWMNIIADENKQGSIYVYEASDLIRKLNQKAYEAEYKVSLIWLPELMNTTCANKILKILEEPQGKTLFILVAEAEEKLLSTIRSRCQFIRVPKISDIDLEAALAVLPDTAGKNPSTLARLARGNFPAALDLLHQDEIRQANFKLFADMMRNGYARKLAGILEWSEEVASIGRVRQLSFLSYCGDFLRENFLVNFKEPDLVSMDEQESAFSQKFAPFISEKNVLSLFREFEKAYMDIAANGNGKLVFTDLGIKVSKLIRL